MMKVSSALVGVILTMFSVTPAFASQVEMPLSFKIKIEGLPDTSFSQMSGIGIDFETTSDNSCDKNSCSLMRGKKGRSKVRDLHLLRRYTGDRSLYEWVQAEKNDKKAKEKEALVAILDANNKQIATYKLHGVWARDYSIPYFNNQPGYSDREVMEELTLSVYDFELK